MCGIYGMVALAGALRWPERADRLAGSVQPRGPDAHHVHTSPEAILGVHRLRVVDPRPEADQPFVHQGHVLAVNGEIYNAPALRRRFAGHPFRSRTDGETLLPILDQLGPAGLRAVEGMFGLAWWAHDTRTLVLARDVHGEKPLFYTHVGSEVWFASAPEALRHHPQLATALDLDAARDQLALGVVCEPRTLFAGVRKVPAGCAVVFRPSGVQIVWYDAEDPIERGPVAASELAQAFDDAVAAELQSDVPIGVFLSGGLDSSLVAQAAAKHQPGMPAFCVGFPESSYDERPMARRVARDLGLPLTEVEAGTSALLRALDIASTLGEPIADPALLPTILLAERTRQDVTVVLSGEGADELFGGYPTYLAHRLAEIPSVARCAVHGARWFRPKSMDHRLPASYLLRRFLEEASKPALERHVAWFAGALPTHALSRPCTVHRAPCTDILDEIMELDRTLWLRERLLVKLDRATMRVGLEGRVPFLHPGVVRLARRVGAATHVGWRGKRLLRALARTRVPAYVLRRTKRGMTVPVGSLLNGALREETDRLLRHDRLDALGLVRTDAVATMLGEHRAHTADHSRARWTLFTYERWREYAGL